MSEELNPSVDNQSAPEEVTVTVDAAPVAPPTVEVPEIPAVTMPENTEVPAAAEQAPESTTAEVEAEPEASPEADTPEDLTISNELVELAVGCIKATRRSSVTHFQRKMGMSMEKATALVEELTNRGILGPANGPYPRKILIQCEAPEKKAPAPKKATAKPRMTDYDRMQDWKKHLAELGKYSDEALVEDLCQFAQKNPGFSANKRWGSCLVVMMNRLANKTRDTLRTFSSSDAEYVVHELLRFLSEDPLGDGPQTWNSKFTTNMEQKAVVSKFFGIDKPFREMRGKQCSCMTAVRDAAWPNQKEEAAGTGGTYAERFHYMAMCIIAMSNGGHHEALFQGSYHSEPTETFLTKFSGGGRPAPRVKQESWHTNGVCNVCGGTVTKDSNGNDICSTPFCIHHFARTAGDVAESFRGGNNRRDEQAAPSDVPVEERQPRKKGNWKNRRRENEEHDGFKSNGKKQRYRSRDVDLDNIGDGSSHNGNGDAPVLSTGGEFNTNPFANLTLPTQEQ